MPLLTPASVGREGKEGLASEKQPLFSPTFTGKFSEFANLHCQHKFQNHGQKWEKERGIDSKAWNGRKGRKEAGAAGGSEGAAIKRILDASDRACNIVGSDDWM